MNKKIIIAILVVIALIAAYYIFQGYPKTPQGNTTVNTPANNGQPTQPVTQGETAAIAIANFSFQPPALTIKTGTTVVWTNEDPTPHQIKSDTLIHQPCPKARLFLLRLAQREHMTIPAPFIPA